ncbi:hypothetical protein RJ55_03132 [Drechmeria coniospora]|nr:hypothetical protein RJ55_03132 [Drechmeria coniospora]
MSSQRGTQPGAADVAENVPASEPDLEGYEDEDAGETRRSEAGPRSGSPVRRIGGGFAAAPMRSPVRSRPSPRPLPPPAPEGDDELNPFIGRRLRRSPPTGVNIPPPPEPELPPAVPDVVSSTPPRGIHSSPSRWRSRDRTKKSSPLKPAAERPVHPWTGKQSALAPRSLHQDANVHQSLPRMALDVNTSFARRIVAFDPDESKKQRKDELMAEIAKLKKDLETGKKENERIRLMQTSGRTVAPTDEDALLDLLQRSLDSGKPTAVAPSSQLAQAVLHPLGILPFGKPSFVTTAIEGEILDPDGLKSHHPVLMTADEELPYLQLFSPFSITSSLAVLPPLPNQPPRQRRLLTLRSRDMPGLFTAKLEMVINAINFSILELGVVSVEPSAKFELGPFIDTICSGKCNRTMQQNVGILSWAMGEWCRVALQRARFWLQLEGRLGSEEQVRITTAETRTRLHHGAEAARKESSAPCTKADLIRLLGRQFYQVRVPAAGTGSSSLRLEWKIGFDWTGEAKSTTAISVSVAGKWRQADQRGVLGRVPKLFGDLVEGGEDADVAVHKVIALLAGE